VRTLAIVALGVLPIALVGWIFYRGATQPLPELVLVESPPAAGPDVKLKALFDGDLGGVTRNGELTLYDEKTLFEYINGAAPIFLERHFRRLAAAELKLQTSELVCDVYDMGEAANATSIFDKERSASAKPVEGWDGAVSGSMSFVFHQGPYYVKLTAFDATAEAALPALARALKGKMK